MSFSQKETRRSKIDFQGDPGLTEQHHKESCDIHNIMRKALKTGIAEHVNKYQGTYMDMPNTTDFQTHMNEIIKANDMFESVPAEIRKKFGNDAGAYIDFMQDPENYDAIEKMGLDNSHLPAPKKKEVKKEPVKPAQDPAKD